MLILSFYLLLPCETCGVCKGTYWRSANSAWTAPRWILHTGHTRWGVCSCRAGSCVPRPPPRCWLCLRAGGRFDSGRAGRGSLRARPELSARWDRRRSGPSAQSAHSETSCPSHWHRRVSVSTRGTHAPGHVFFLLRSTFRVSVRAFSLFKELQTDGREETLNSHLTAESVCFHVNLVLSKD